MPAPRPRPPPPPAVPTQAPVPRRGPSRPGSRSRPNRPAGPCWARLRDGHPLPIGATVAWWRRRGKQRRRWPLLPLPRIGCLCPVGPPSCLEPALLPLAPVRLPAPAQCLPAGLPQSEQTETQPAEPQCAAPGHGQRRRAMRAVAGRSSCRLWRARNGSWGIAHQVSFFGLMTGCLLRGGRPPGAGGVPFGGRERTAPPSSRGPRLGSRRLGRGGHHLKRWRGHRRFRRCK